MSQTKDGILLGINSGCHLCPSFHSSISDAVIDGDQTDEPLTMTRGGTTYYYFADGLGSIRQLTNSAGAVQQTYDYNSYGKLAAAPTVANPFTYTGREYDVESGNYYYRARYYNPTLGRFLQRDPIGYYDSTNLYQYVFNSPLNYKDPYGLQAAPAVPIIIWITILVLVFTGYKTIQTCPPQQIPVFDLQSFVIPVLIFGGGNLPMLPTILKKDGSGKDNTTNDKKDKRPRKDDLPAQNGPPDGSLSKDHGNGEGQIREYDENGRAKVDYDFGHDHGSGDPHAHDWDWSKKFPRQRHRPLNLGE